MIESDWRPVSNRRPLLKSASTDFIISNHCPIWGYSQIGVLSKFSDLWPIYCYQIDVLFRAKICMCFYLLTWWMLVKFMHHLHHCLLYQMNAKRYSFRHKFSVPDQHFVYEKSSSATLLFKQVWKQNLIRHWMASKVQNSKLLSSGCFQAVFMQISMFYSMFDF
jgi:hypothetical protein